MGRILESVQMHFLTRSCARGRKSFSTILMITTAVLRHSVKKEQDTMKDMKIVQEMYARGFEFEPLDIYKAQATKFLIVNGKLMPPLSSIDGMGEKVAEAVAEASKDGTYLSLDDFRQRTKASKTVIDTMVELGILADLPASNQLSLFDF